jgi:putative tryptophan/tyrosine transport system substrate-binding protein
MRAPGTWGGSASTAERAGAEGRTAVTPDRTRRTRRQFLRSSATLAGLLLAGCGPLSLPWQQPARVPRIGFLATGGRPGRQFIIDGLLEGLREHGYEEGRNILIEYRFSDDDNSRLPALAAALVELGVDLIVASGTPASVAARDATTTVPIVMGGLAAHPTEAGFVESLHRPGRNITGMSLMTTLLGGKRLEFFTEMVPGLSRVAVFNNPDSPTYPPVLREFDAAAQTLGLEILRLEVRTAADFPGAFELATQAGAGALIAPGDPLTTNQMGPLAGLALQHRMPMLMEYREFAEAGGLMVHGPNLADSYRRCAEHVQKILQGADPATLPMQLPTKLDVVVNLGTARALGIALPPSILFQAELIQ